MDTFETARLKLRVNGDTLLYDFQFGQGDNAIWFTLTEEEIRDILLKGGTAHDLLRRIELSSDRILIYNVDGLSYEGPDHGRREVKYHRLNFPLHLWQIMLRYGKLAKAYLLAKERDPEAKWEEKVIVRDLSLARRQRWLKLYGMGKGQLKVEMPEESRAFFVECAARSPEFVERYENVERIALNSTYGYMETARVSISKDYDGFYWCAYAPDGRRIMNGGIINHGTPEKPDWSIHT